jgi:hypothetical protein
VATPSPAGIERRARIRRGVRAASRVALGLVVALALLAALVAYQAATIVRAGAVAVAETFGARIGREVTVGRAHVHLGSLITVRIDDVRIAAAPGQTGDAARPLFELAALEVKVTAWSILRSFGKRVDVRGIEARSPVLRLVRAAGGELSYSDVVQQLREAPPPPDRGGQGRAEDVRVTGARVELHDLSRDPDHGGVHLAIDAIDVAIPEISAQAPFELTLDAAVLAPDRNLHLEVGMAPRDAPPGLLGRLRRLAVKLSALLVDPLLPFVPDHARVGIAGGAVRGELAVAVDDAGVASVRASAGAAGLRLVHDREGHEEPLARPFDVSVAGEARVDPAGPALDVRTLSVSIEGMTLDARADLRGPVDSPEVRALEVTTRDVTFERLLALVHPAALPADLSLRGPIALHASAHGPPRAAEIDVAVDLGGAAIAHPDFEKPAGVPLSAELVGRAGDGLTIDSLGLRLGPLALMLHGRVGSESDVDLAFDTGEVALDALLRLLPKVARRVPATVTLAGNVKASGHLKRGGEESDADVHVALRGADVETPALTLHGAAVLGVKAHATAVGAAKRTLEADLDASGLRARVPGRFDKAAGAPLVVHARASREGGVTTVEEARLNLAGATIAGHGRRDERTGATQVELPTCELDLGALSRAIPALVFVPPQLSGARLRAAVTFDGTDGAPGTAHVHLGGVDLVAPFGHVTGMVDVRGLAPVREVAFDLVGDVLDLGPVAAGAGGAARASGLGGLDAHGTIHVGRLHAGSFDARDVDVGLALRDGSIALTLLRLEAFGGVINAAGSRVDLARPSPSFSVHARAEHLDLATLAAASANASAGSEVAGKLDADVSLEGSGADWTAIAPTLAGTVKIDASALHVHGRRTLRGTVINPLLHKLAEKANEQHTPHEVDTHIAKASVGLRIAGGAFTITSPLILAADEGTITVEGTVALDRTLALHGSVAIPPAAIERATKGFLLPYHDVTVRLRVDGPSDAPRIELLELDRTVSEFKGSWRHAVAKKLFGAE